MSKVVLHVCCSSIYILYMCNTMGLSALLNIIICTCPEGSTSDRGITNLFYFDNRFSVSFLI